MNVEQAMKIILKPYITEKTFAMIENENNNKVALKSIDFVNLATSNTKVIKTKINKIDYM